MFNIDFNKLFGVQAHGDKIAHIIAGFIIAFVVTMLSSPLYGAIVTSVVAVAKEVYDYYEHGTFDGFDVFATLFGMFFGVVVGGELAKYLGA